MLTKGAIGNLVNRYRAVLKKCNLINTFGSLAVASMLVLGGAAVAEATDAKYMTAYQGTSSVQEKLNPPHSWDETGAAAGWVDEAGSAEVTSISTTVTGVKGDLIVGGNFAKEKNKDAWSQQYKNSFSSTQFRFISTDNIVSDSSAEGVIGGNHLVLEKTDPSPADPNNPAASALTITGTGHSAKLTITDGSFGGLQSGTHACPEFFIIAGDVIKGNSSQHHTSGLTSASSTLSSTSLVISGGSFNAPVFGGSGSLEFYGGVMGGLSTHVNTANVKITDGEFLDPIFAGGLSFHCTSYADDSAVTKSTVDEAFLTIDGSDSEKLSISDVYAGGLQFKGHVQSHVNTANTTVGNANVGHATISIKNATVSNIYGSEGLLHGTDTGGGNYYLGTNGEYDYSQNTEDYARINTDLTLTNVTASGDVYVPVGSITLASANAGSVEVKGTLTAASSSAVTVTGDSQTNDAIGGDAAKLANYIKVNKAVDAAGNEFKLFEEKTSVNLAPGTIVGAVTGTVENGVANTTEKPNETNVAMAEMPDINHMITRVEMNDLRKRMGDIRLLEGNTGVWARWDGGKLKGDAGLTNNFHKIQAGIDTTTGIDNLRLGAAFSYTNSDMEFANADADSDTMSLAAYGVWTADNGMFADVIARIAFIDTEIKTDRIKGDLNNLAFSLSGEYGWRFDVCKSFFVEPQLELTYTYVDSDEFTSAGAKFDFDSSDSLIGRAGLAAGWKLPNELGEVYARASVVQEFMGDGKLTASMGNTVRYYETDGDDTWFEYGVGANVKLTKNAYIFADVERTEGADIDEEWRGTVGFRYSF